MCKVTSDFINNFNCFTDLHLHLDGSLSNANIRQLAKIANVDLPLDDKEMEKLFRVDETCKDLTEFLEKFEYPTKLLQKKETLKIATSNLIKEIATDGVMYAEIRFAPLLHVKEGLTQDDVVEAVLEGAEKSEIPVNIILCCMRGQDIKDNLETIEIAKKYKDSGVVAVDLAGAEALFGVDLYSDIFEKAREYDIPFTLHAGEADGARSVEDAVNLGAVRIGHGVRASEDKNTLEMLKQKNILLELCPTSNLLTKVFKDLSDYPIKKFMERKLKISINTDDMAVCNTNIRKEWQSIVETFDINKNEMKQILTDSVNYSFADSSTKQELLSKLEKAF